MLMRNAIEILEVLYDLAQWALPWVTLAVVIRLSHKIKHLERTIIMSTEEERQLIADETAEVVDLEAAVLALKAGDDQLAAAIAALQADGNSSGLDVATLEALVGRFKAARQTLTGVTDALAVQTTSITPPTPTQPVPPTEPAPTT